MSMMMIRMIDTMLMVMLMIRMIDTMLMVMLMITLMMMLMMMTRMIDSTEEGRLRGPRIEWHARAKRSPPQNPTNVLSRKILEISTLESLTPSHQGGDPKQNL